MAAQFAARWYWFVGLSIGFGAQVGLFSYLRAWHTGRVSAAMATVSGTTSGGAMLACCAHYLVNLLPLVGIGGIAVVIGQYQTELFVLSAAANVAGLGYLIRKLVSVGGYGNTEPPEPPQSPRWWQVIILGVILGALSLWFF